MSSRYYLAPLAQNSKGQWRPSLLDSAAWASEVSPEIDVMTSGFTDGQPHIPWCFCAVDAQNHQALSEVVGIDLLPDYPLDGRMSAMPQATRASLDASLEARSVDTSGVTGGDAYRDLLGAIATHLGNTGFDADAFTV